MSKMYYDQDANLDLLSGKTVAVIGFGSQGHAQAQNLRDSGINVVVGQRPGSANYELAKELGFEPVSAGEAAAKADVIQILVPDEVQAQLYKNEIAPHLSAGKALVFSHGFNIHFGQIKPPSDVDVFMVAPKTGIGAENIRGRCRGALPDRRPPGCNWPSTDLALAYAKGIGGTRAGVIETTFKRKQKQTFSASRLCSAAAYLNSSVPVLKPWLKLAISRRLHISNVSTR